MQPAENYADQRRGAVPRQTQRQRVAPSGIKPSAAQGDEEVEVKEMFEVLRSDISGVEVRLNRRIDDVKEHLGERIEQTKDRIEQTNDRIAEVKTDLVDQIKTLRTNVGEIFSRRLIAMGAAAAVAGAIAVVGTFALQIHAMLP